MYAHMNAHYAYVARYSMDIVSSIKIHLLPYTFYNDHIEASITTKSILAYSTKLAKP